MENVTDLYAHAQTVDTRCSFPIFQAPRYEAICLASWLGAGDLCKLCIQHATTVFTQYVISPFWLSITGFGTLYCTQHIYFSFMNIF